MRINLWINWYVDVVKLRQKELETSLLNNLKNIYIDNVYLLTDEDQIIVNNLPLVHPKIIVVPHLGRPTVADFFRSVKKFTQPEDINIIQNTDCWWEDIAKVYEIKKNEVYCVSRWNLDDPLGALRQAEYSQDAWVIRGCFPPEDDLEFYLGTYGIDNYLAYWFHQRNYKIINPCLSLKLRHEHVSEIRRNSIVDKVERPNLFVPPGTTEGFSKHINWYIRWHLGDCLWHMKIMREIAKYYPDVTQTLYCNRSFFRQLEPLLIKNIFLGDINKKPKDAIDIWCCQLDDFGELSSPNYLNMNLKLANVLLHKVKLKLPIRQASDLIFDFEEIIKTKSEIDGDVLVVNSVARSGQWRSLSCFDGVIRKFKREGLKVVTTNRHPLADVCTLDYNMDVLKIAALSTRCKVVVGVHTAPIILCLNKWTLANIEKFIVCDRYGHFFLQDGSKFVNIYSPIELKRFFM